MHQLLVFLIFFFFAENVFGMNGSLTPNTIKWTLVRKQYGYRSEEQKKDLILEGDERTPAHLISKIRISIEHYAPAPMQVYIKVPMQDNEQKQIYYGHTIKVSKKIIITPDSKKDFTDLLKKHTLMIKIYK